MPKNDAVKRANVLDQEAISEALAYIELHSTQKLRDRLLVLLTCKLGLRAQEAALLHAEDILDLRGDLKKVFFVSKRSAKCGKTRELPMHPLVREALQAYLDHYKSVRIGPLFTNQFGQPLTASAVHKHLARIYEAIGLQGCSSHSGRRTFGTNVIKRNTNIVVLKKLLGHSDIRTTETYVGVTTEEFSVVMGL
jgi:integrase/recombinase XerD